MQTPMPTPTTYTLLPSDVGIAGKVDPDARRSKSHLSIRTDRDGNKRWFHATKGWRDLVRA